MTAPAMLRLDAADAQRAQSQRALQANDRAFMGIPWPWQAVTDVLYHVQPGTVHIIAAPSGNGKTTFAVSAALWWIEHNVTVVYAGFERSPEDLRRYFAAVSLGLHPGRVLSGRWEEDDDFLSQRQAMEDRLREMAANYHPWDKLHFTPHDYASVRAIEDVGATVRAYDHGFPALAIIDHADHLGRGRADGIRASVDVLTAMQSHAKAHGTRWLVFKQINNRELNKSGTTLPRHRPMPVSAISLGQLSEEISWTVSCLYQPLRLDVTTDELKAVNEGRSELRSVLWEGVTCLALLKDRDMGQAGRKMLLGWDNGRIVDAHPSVRLAVEAKTHGIKTHSGF